MTDIRGYTIAQAEAFGEAAERERSRDMADAAWLTRAAHHYKPKQFEKTMKEFQGE